MITASLSSIRSDNYWFQTIKKIWNIDAQPIWTGHQTYCTTFIANRKRNQFMFFLIELDSWIGCLVTARFRCMHRHCIERSEHTIIPLTGGIEDGVDSFGPDFFACCWISNFSYEVSIVVLSTMDCFTNSVKKLSALLMDVSSIENDLTVQEWLIFCWH